MLAVFSKNCVLLGDVDSYCLVCSIPLTVDDLEHIRSPEHNAKLKQTVYFEKYKDDFIKKVKGVYFCEACNKTFSTAAKVGMHVTQETHIKGRRRQLTRLGTSVVFQKDTLIEENAWNGLVEDTCVVCNADFDDHSTHISEHSHALNVVRSTVTIDDDNNIYRKVDGGYQCLTCNKFVFNIEISKHLDSEQHKATRVSLRCTRNDAYNNNIDQKKEEKKEQAKENEANGDDTKVTSKKNVDTQVLTENPSVTEGKAVKKLIVNEELATCANKHNFSTEYNYCTKQNTIASTVQVEESFQCLTCNKVISNTEISKHLDSEQHKAARVSLGYTRNYDDKNYIDQTNKNKMEQTKKNEASGDDTKVTSSSSSSSSAHCRPLLNEGLPQAAPTIPVLGNPHPSAASHFPQVVGPSKVTSNKNVDTKTLTKNLSVTEGNAIKKLIPVSKELETFANEHGLFVTQDTFSLNCQICNTVVPGVMKYVQNHISGKKHTSNQKQQTQAYNELNIMKIEKVLSKDYCKETLIVNHRLWRYVIINDSFCLEFNHFFCMLDIGSIICQLCDIEVTRKNREMHVFSPSHEFSLQNAFVITSLKDEFVRQIRSRYHCGFCGVFQKEYVRMLNHLSTPIHEHQKITKKTIFQSIKDELLPSKDEELPIKDEELPSKDEELPSKDEQLPNKDEQLPSKDEQLPSKDEQLPSKDEQLPSKDEQLPSKDEEVPSKNEEISSIMDPWYYS